MLLRSEDIIPFTLNDGGTGGLDAFLTPSYADMMYFRVINSEHKLAQIRKDVAALRSVSDKSRERILARRFALLGFNINGYRTGEIVFPLKDERKYTPVDANFRLPPPDFGPAEISYEIEFVVGEKKLEPFDPHKHIIRWIEEPEEPTLWKRIKSALGL